MNIVPRIAAAWLAATLCTGCVGAAASGNCVEAESVPPRSPITLFPNGVAQKSGRPLLYGTEKAAVVELLERFGPVGQTTNEECGAGPMDFVVSAATGLTANFQNDRLVGWFYDGDGTSARTARDVSTGTSREALERAMPIEMQTESTLGVEFFSGAANGGFIAGFLSDESDNAVVESLYSGTNCFFR